MKNGAGGRLRPRMRDDLIYGSHPDDPERGRVLVMRTGRQVEILPPLWRVARAFDGSRTLGEIAGASVELFGRELDELLLSAIAEELDGKGLLELSAHRGGPKPRGPRRYGAEAQWTAVPRTERLPIAVHPEARFSCEGTGTCCESGYVVPLTSLEVRRVRAAAAGGTGSVAGASGVQDPVRMMPTAMNAPWTYALATEPRCAFLDDRQRCQVHATAAHPSSCRIFPYRFVAAPERIHVSVSHRCVCGTLGRGELLSAQRPELRRRLNASRYVHALPESTRVDGLRTVDTERAVAALILAFESAQDPFAILASGIEQLLSVAPIEAIEPSEPRSNGAGKRVRPIDPPDLYRRLGMAIAPAEPGQPMASLRRALDGEEHALHGLIVRHQKAGGLYEPGADPVAEVGRFVRDHVFGLQLYRYSTLASGLVALGLAAARILYRLPEEAHPAARERIMLWENVLATRTLVGLLGASGPVARVTRTLESARAQIAALAAFAGAGP